jgi:hypothetical protein
MTNYLNITFLNTLNFKKCNLKSPIGGGLYILYINETENIIYKKIRRKIKDVYNFKKIIYNLKNNQILSEYIFEPEKIYIENDCSYYSMFIANGIRLYDIAIGDIIDFTTLIKLKECILNLKNILNDYVKTNKLSGDWALHNLIYCLDTNKIYNVDLEGFYTYPLIHDNGNCNIKNCNTWLDKVLEIIENKLIS